MAGEGAEGGRHLDPGLSASRNWFKGQHLQELAEQKFHPKWMGNIPFNDLVGGAFGR
jgi:hypothetical protein